MAKEVFSRVEYKYLISQKSVDKLQKLLKTHMNLDNYNLQGKTYTVFNIYFDTSSDELIVRSLEKPIYKEKLRLRSYGPVKKEDVVYLELKKKFKGIVYKRRTPILLEEAYDFIEYGKIPEKSNINKQVFKEIQDLMNRYDLKPKVFLSYERFAYFSKENPEFRITLDKNIQSTRKELTLEKNIEGNKILKENEWLMEAKGVNSFPLWFAHFLSDNKIQQTSFSKYGKSYELYN